MSKKDEVIKYSQELKKVLHDWNGENCQSKSEKIAEKAQSLGVPWKTVQCMIDAKIFGLDQYSMTCPHEYAIVDGQKVDVAGDPVFRNAMKGSEVKETNKMVMDEYFSKKHTWRDVMQLLSKKMSEMGIQQVDVNIDKKYIIFFDVNFDDDKQEIVDFVSSFGVNCRFKLLKNDVYVVHLKKISEDKSNAKSSKFAYWKIMRKQSQFRREMDKKDITAQEKKKLMKQAKKDKI